MTGTRPERSPLRPFPINRIFPSEREEFPMPALSQLYFRTAVLFLVLGIIMGLQMSISGNHDISRNEDSSLSPGMQAAMAAARIIVGGRAPKNAGEER